MSDSGTDDINWDDLGDLLEEAVASDQQRAPHDIPGQAQKQTEAAPRTWRAQDLTTVLDGTYEAPQPSVGCRTDGAGLFYPGRMNSIASEMEAGKTWFALACCASEMAQGNHVVYLDFEDDAGGVVGRLLTIGATRDDIREKFHYIRPEAKPSRMDIADLGQSLNPSPTLVIIDGVTEAMSLYGLELKDNTDVAKFGRELLRPLTNTGAAVVTLDHVVKSTENRGRYAVGGVHKANGLNGVMYMLENRTPFGIGVVGRSTIRIAKDRPGQLRRNALPHSSGMHWYGDLVVDSKDETFADVCIYPPIQRDEEDRQEREEEKRLTGIKAKVLDVIRKAPEPLSKKGIEDRVTGKAAEVRRAVAALEDEGLIEIKPGPRNASLHSIKEPSS